MQVHNVQKIPEVIRVIWDLSYVEAIRHYSLHVTKLDLCSGHSHTQAHVYVGLYESRLWQ